MVAKNSSMPTQDIQMWLDEGVIVFNGPDEQLIAGLATGAIGGIGGTYAAMPELYNRIFRLYHEGKMEEARLVQNECCRIIYKICEAKGNLYAGLKEILRLRGGPDVGSVRAPLLELFDNDHAVITQAVAMIDHAVETYC